MKGETGNRTESVDVKAALKGLNWLDKMQTARALRMEKLHQKTPSKNQLSENDLHPIFKQLKQTRPNAVAEARLPTQPDSAADVQIPVKEAHRGMRLAAAVALGKTDLETGREDEKPIATVVSPPFAAKAARTADEEPCPETKGHGTNVDDALILVSPVMDGEVLDEEPDRNRNAVVATPSTNRGSGWRPATGFGFGVGLGVGLSILLGVALLGSFFGQTGNETSATAETGGTLQEASAQSASLAKVTSEPTVADPAPISSAAPTVDTSPPLLLTRFALAGNSSQEFADTNYSQHVDVLVASNPRAMAVLPAPEEQPEAPVFVPGSPSSPAPFHAQARSTAAVAPVDKRLDGADRYTAVLIAPVKLAEDKVEIVAENLRETGLSLRPVHRVKFKVGADQVRFYHSEDSELAGAIAERIGAQARDFTNFRPLPPTGSIEIYLAGNGRPAARKQEPTEKPVAAFKDLRNRIFTRSR